MLRMPDDQVLDPRKAVVVRKKLLLFLSMQEKNCVHLQSFCSWCRSKQRTDCSPTKTIYTLFISAVKYLSKHEACYHRFLDKITPVFSPTVCKPPKNLACSILMQRSCTKTSPVSCARLPTSSLRMPSCSQRTLAPIAMASSAIGGISSALRKTSTISICSPAAFASVRLAYTRLPRICCPA